MGSRQHGREIRTYRHVSGVSATRCQDASLTLRQRNVVASKSAENAGVFVRTNAARCLPPQVEMLRLTRSSVTETRPPPDAVLPCRLMTLHEAAAGTRPRELRHVWHSLWSRTPRASFRQTPEFLEASLASRPSTERLDPKQTAERWRFLIVSAWQRPIGIVPLRERTVRRTLGSFRVIALPESPWGTCPGPVGPHPAMTLAAAVRHLVEHDDSWDMLELPELVATDAEPTHVPSALATGRFTVRRSHQELLGLELPATFGQFWADRDAASRQRWRELEARRSIRRDEQFVRFHTGGAIHGDTERDWEFLKQLERVVRLQEGTPHAARSRALFERLLETHPFAVDSGSADVAVWFSNSQPAAFAYNFQCRSRVETALLLADPNIPHATDRLLGMMLRDEILRGDSWHLFLPGSLQGTTVDRRLWRPTELHETTVTHDRRATIRSRLQRWLDGDRRVTSTSRC